ncbi:MAG: aminoacetone oxidase family FAD-binding enzyme [Clostridia bacterium]|nr:aminoacetone oxidase family FAD-binding enzyme [Clostridia bacterium]
MAAYYDTIIVGGGASGLAAAVFCARFAGGDKVLLLERSARVGRKLLSTGNGTCNLSNRHVSTAAYHGENAAAFTAPALAAFPVTACTDFFASLGVLCTAEADGRTYPLCRQAAAVLDCLRLELQRHGVTERCDTAVTALVPNEKGWQVTTTAGEFSAKQVIVCTGGAASPSLGGSTDGYALLTALGHRRTPLFPSVVQVKTETDWVRAVKGLRTDATVTFLLDGKPLCSRTDELLFTEYGISGPAVMYISRVAGDWERRKVGDMTVQIDLLPTLSHEELSAAVAARGNRTGEDFFTGILHKRIGQTVCRAAGFSLVQDMSRLTAAQQKRLVDTVKGFTVKVLGTQGFGGAQVTAGGIATADICPNTMESRLAKGLYLVGELLDVDGDCGGYNLHWAWASAYAAAKAVCGT